MALLSNFLKNALYWVLFMLFVLFFNVFVLIHAADQTFLNAGFITSSLDSSQALEEIYVSQPLLAQSGMPLTDFNSLVVSAFSNLIAYLRGEQAEFTILANGQSAVPPLPFDASLLAEARDLMVLLLQWKWFFLLADILLLAAIIAMASTLIERLQFARKAFWRASVSLIISMVLSFVLLQGFPSLFSSPAAAPKLLLFISNLSNAFMLAMLLPVAITFALAILLWAVEKFVLKKS